MARSPFRPVFVLTLMWFSAITLYAQSPVFETVNMPPGFDANYIADIRQDTQGFLWIATGSGLLRYDGYNWTIYRHDPKNANSLAANNISSVCPTRDGLIWVAAWGSGLDCLNPETGVITHHPLTTSKSYQFNENAIYVLREDRQGTLWIGTKNGLYRRDAQKNAFVNYLPDVDDPNSLSDYDVPVIYEDRQGTLWVGTGDPENRSSLKGGLNKLDKKTGRFTQYLHDPKNSKSLANNQIFALFEDSRGTFWVGTARDGLHTMDRKSGTLTHYPTQTNHAEKLSRPYSKLKNLSEVGNDGIRFFVEDPSGAVWIGAVNGGANRFDPSSGRVTHFESPSDGLPDFNLLSAYRTRDGVIWMGTIPGHLIKILANPSPLKKVITRSGVHIFREDDYGTFLLGTIGGLVPREPIAPRSHAWLSEISKNTHLLTEHITRLDRDKQNDWWISTWVNGLYYYQQSTNEFTHFQHNSLNPSSLSKGEVIGVYQDRAGKRWVPTSGGLDKLDVLSGKFIHYRHDPKDSSSISASSCLGVLEDRYGSFWVGTQSGLNLMDRKTGKFTRFLGWDIVTQLLEDANGTVWVAAYSGLHHYDRAGKRFVPFLDQNTGKPLPFVRAIAEDNSGNLWASTPMGIASINKSRNSLRWFGANYGIPASEDFFFGSSYRSKDGQIFFGSMEKYFHFDPKALLRNRETPPILAITALRIHNEPVKAGNSGILPVGLAHAKSINLNYNQNVFSLDFAAIDFRHPELHLYTCKLENYDADWRPIGSERTINYYNIPPGEYTFRVKAANSDNFWVEKLINITISPPLWRTPWAYALYTCLLISLFYAGWLVLLRRERSRASLRLRDIKAQQALEMDRMKATFFTNISHEFRTPLSLIIGPLEKWLSESTGETPYHASVQLMHRNAKRLLQLVNQLLDISRMEAGKMTLETQPGDLIHFFQRVTGSFASLAESRRIKFTVIFPEGSLWVSFDADKLEKILTNLLSNAFKFTGEGGSVHVYLRVSPLPLALQTRDEKAFLLAEFIVKDTGIGIPNDQQDRIFDRFHQVDNSLTRTHEGSGIGLSLTRELVLLHQGTIAVASEMGKGTEFTISLPLELIHVSQADQLPHTPVNHYYADATSKESFNRTKSGEALENIDESTLKPLVLIVEDNTDLRQFIRESLTEHAVYRVLEATNGKDGYELAQEEIPDMVVSDVMMPYMNGFELCRRLKTNENTSHIPVILLTAKASGEAKIEGLETGADDYLTKPFVMSELLARINNLIEGRRLLKERFSKRMTLQPKDIAITSTDEHFLKRVMDIIEQNIENVNFGVDILGREIGMSRMQLYRKLQALTDQSPSDFIRTIRLQRAAQLLAKNSGSVSQIADQVGFGSHSYFSKCFVEQYGKTPKEYVADQQNNR